MKPSALFGCMLIAALGVGCARPSPKTAETAPKVHQSAGEAGKILTMRRLVSYGAQDPWRGVLLTGTAAKQPMSDGADPLVEFIVRTDDGATLSIVQPNQTGLRAGDRVLVLHGDSTRLAPAG